MSRLYAVLLAGALGAAGSEAAGQVPDTPITGAMVPCEAGTADVFPCHDVDLLSFLPPTALGSLPGTTLNDVWGWTDPQTGREYALVGKSDGTAFVDVTDPVNPVYLGSLPTHSLHSAWRAIKVYGDHAFIVSEASEHGMQVFDLTRLRGRGASDPPVDFEETAHYDGFHSAHTLFANEATGYVYVAGSHGEHGDDGQVCAFGLHIVDVRTPAEPQFAGCFRTSLGRGYTHEVQCVVYHGPDADHQGREICVGSDEVGITVSDVTDKAAPAEVSTLVYPNVGYTHQGWFTDDHRYFLVNDELDELNGLVPATRTILIDLADLDAPRHAGDYFGPTTSIDHNLYIDGRLVYESNYTSGLRVLRIDRDDAAGTISLREMGFFDTYPAGDPQVFDGPWSNYPFFESGTIVVSSIRQGFFALRRAPALTAVDEGAVPGSFALSGAYPNPFDRETTLRLTLPGTQAVRLEVYDGVGRLVARLFEGTLAAGTHAFPFAPAGLPPGLYFVRAMGPSVDTRAVLYTGGH